MSSGSKRETATLAGGCFWCLEAVFVELAGVHEVESGYTGGQVANPTYRQVCDGTTGHAEAVKITFDPSVITYGDLLDVFFTIHDLTTLNRQGGDSGTQYRSAIYTHSAEQKSLAAAKIAELNKSGIWSAPIVTEIDDAGMFYAAEAYHQDYFAQNPQQPYCQAVVAPKVAKARKVFFEKLKKKG